MKSLRVEINYSTSEYIGSLPLPIRVLDAEGGVLHESTAATGVPATFDIPDDVDPVFVRLAWPSGRTETRRVNFEGTAAALIQFTDAHISHNEWAAWAVPRLGGHTQRVSSDTAGRGISQYNDVWLRWWKFENGWQVFVPNLSAVYKSDSARQIDLTLEQCAYLLQIGGPSVPWKFVSLPGAGRTQVLITPNTSSDPRADPLRTAITGFRADAETLLEFLVRDSMRSANALAEFGPVATRLMSDKTEDPVAALAGGYFLLRVGGCQGRETWFENLFHMAPWTPDSAILLCAVQLRGGTTDLRQPVSSLRAAVRRGSVPVFAEGFTLMQECVSLLRARTGSLPVEAGESPTEELGPLADLLTARAWSGSIASFYGKTPHAPSLRKYIGPLDRPRLQKTVRSVRKAARLLPTPPPAQGEASSPVTAVRDKPALSAPPGDALRPKKQYSRQAAKPVAATGRDYIMLGDL